MIEAQLCSASTGDNLCRFFSSASFYPSFLFSLVVFVCLFVLFCLLTFLKLEWGRWVGDSKEPNQDSTTREFPGGRIVRTQCFHHCWGLGSIPGLGTELPHQPTVH